MGEEVEEESKADIVDMTDSVVAGAVWTAFCSSVVVGIDWAPFKSSCSSS